MARHGSRAVGLTCYACEKSGSREEVLYGVGPAFICLSLRQEKAVEAIIKQLHVRWDITPLRLAWLEFLYPSTDFGSAVMSTW